jgi:hypothetical protein
MLPRSVGRKLRWQGRRATATAKTGGRGGRVVISGPGKAAAMCRGLFFNPVVRGHIRRRSATHANFDGGIRGLKPHGYRQETAPRSFKTSKLLRGAGKPR